MYDLGAFVEDLWKVIVLGGIKMNVCKPCSRCKVPNINPATGMSECTLLMIDIKS